MPIVVLLLLLPLAVATAHAFPTSMYSCDDLPTPGGSLPGDGNQLMQISSVLPGEGGYCQITGLPVSALPCTDYVFSVSSSSSSPNNNSKLAQLVAVSNTAGALRPAPAGAGTATATAKSDQCVAVNSPVQTYSYVWTSPDGDTPSTSQVTALCGKMGQVFAATPVFVTVPQGANASACAARSTPSPTLAAAGPPPQCIVPIADMTDNAQFDYYTLALQWPPGVRSTAPNVMQSAFCRGDVTLRGLWPSRGGGALSDPTTFPHDCTEQPFRAHDLNPSLRKAMAKHWPSLKQPGLNAAMWNHEWQVHGTCVTAPAGGEFPGQYEYFLAALRLRSLFADQLESNFFAKFPPSTKTRYRVADIVEFWGGGVVLQCEGDVLTEFRFCLNKDSKEQQPCPVTACNCGSGNGVQRVFILPKDCSDPQMEAVLPALALILVFVLLVPVVYCVVYRHKCCCACCYRRSSSSLVEDGGGGDDDDEEEDRYSSSSEEDGRHHKSRRAAGGLEEEEAPHHRPVIRRKDQQEDDFEI